MDKEIRQSIEIIVVIVPTIIFYGNFILIGIISGVQDILRLSNPLDQLFIISIGAAAGLSGLVASYFTGRSKNLRFLSSILIALGIGTGVYVLFVLYSEIDSPDTMIEKLYLLPIYASVILGFRQLYRLIK